MCDPVSLAVASTVVSAGSAVMGGYQQQAAAKFQAAQANQNAQLAAKQADQIQIQGADEALQLQRRIHAVSSAQTAGYAAQGLDVSFGSPADMIAGTAQMGAEDAARLRQTTQDHAQGLMIQSSNYSDSASAQKVAGSNAVTSGWMKAAGTVLSGASQIQGMGKAGGG